MVILKEPRILLFKRRKLILKTRRFVKGLKTTFLSKRCLSRILNTITFLLCMGGFFYQTSTFVEEFYKYPSVVDIQVKQPYKYPVPALTFCNWNPLKRSKFCAKYPGECERPVDIEKFCKEKPYYCTKDMTNFTLPKRRWYSGVLKPSDMQELGHRFGDFFQRGYDYAKGPFFFNFILDFPLSPCYSVNERYDSGEEPRIDTYYAPKASWTYRPEWGQFVLDVEADETFYPEADPTAIMAVHSPFDYVFPRTKCIFLKPGVAYLIDLSIEEKHLLPHPYKTDCVDYEELWEKNNRTGPRSQIVCRLLCNSQYDLACYGCETELTVNPKLSQFCVNWRWDSGCKDEERKRLQAIKDICLSRCKAECTKLLYHYSVQEMDLSAVLGRKAKPHLLAVEVRTDGSGIQVLSYNPRYTDVEFFIYIGGLVGMWVGISVWAVSNYAADVFFFIKALLRKRKIRKRKSKVGLY